MDRAVYWIWLQRALGVGAHQSEAILQRFDDAEQVYRTMIFSPDLALTPLQQKRLRDKDLAAATKELTSLQQLGAWALTPEDPLYIAMFEGVYAPPVVLYAKGQRLSLREAPTVAIVGTRHHDETGERITRKLAAGLAAAGATVVSGGAEGLDSAALEAALNENGRCLSFQACGIDVEYPRAVAPLRRRLLEQGGLLMTEFPLGSSAHRHHFRIRNRLISAVADGTLVTQAPLGSGALITAEWAREQGKDVFAVPGAVGVPCCEGSNELLKDGARLVTNAADILTEYLEQYPFTIRIDAAAAAERRALQVAVEEPAHKHRPLYDENPSFRQVASPAVQEDRCLSSCPDGIDDIGKRLYASLAKEPKTVSELAREQALDTSDVLSALTELELYGAVFCGAGQRYMCNFEK